MIIRELLGRDRTAVHEMLVACGAFTAEEVRVALELIDEGLSGAGQHGYLFFAAEVDGEVCGYVCIGKTPMTLATWYLYWICVHPRAQRTGVGRALQVHVEAFIREKGGERLVLETSGQPAYERTRRFYAGGGSQEVGRIQDFYKPKDDCIIFCKELAAGEKERRAAQHAN